MTKQRHTAWLCKGVNRDEDGNEEARPTWFYVFRTGGKALEFMDKSQATFAAHVRWELIPCEFMEVDETLANMEECINMEGDTEPCSSWVARVVRNSNKEECINS